MYEDIKYIDINLKYTRQRLGIQQKDFAEAIGILRTTLSRIENENKIMVKHFAMIHHTYPEYFPFPDDFDEFKDEYIYQYNKIYGEYPSDVTYPTDYFDYNTENLVLNIQLHKEVSEEEIATIFGYTTYYSVKAAIRKNRNFYHFKEELNKLFVPYFVIKKKEKKKNSITYINDLMAFREKHNLTKSKLSAETNLTVSVITRIEEKIIIPADIYIILNSKYQDDFPLPEDFNDYSAMNFYYNFLGGYSKYSKSEIAKRLGYVLSTAIYKKIQNTKNFYDQKELVDTIFEPFLIASCRKNGKIENVTNELKNYACFKNICAKIRKKD